MKSLIRLTQYGRSELEEVFRIAGSIPEYDGFLKGKTVVTFLFDSVYTWAVPATLSFVLCRFTELDIVTIYFAVQFIDIVKIFIGVPLLRSGFWANRIVGTPEGGSEP